MKTLSLHQPWASAIALGLKRIETRGWRTSYRGPIAIHAALACEQDAAIYPDVAAAWERFRAELDLSRFASHTWREGVPAALPAGAFVAIADLAGIVATEEIHPGPEEARFGNYAPQRFAWVLSHVLPVLPPVPERGHQGLRPAAAGLDELLRARAGAPPAWPPRPGFEPPAIPPQQSSLLPPCPPAP